MSTRIRVLLVDDHDVVRAGFSRLLEAGGECIIVGEARDADSGTEAYFRLQPDVVIMDLSMPGQGGLEAIKRIRARDEQARVLVLTVHENEPFPQRALAAGALGYLTKRCAPEELLEAVSALAKGEGYIASNIRPMLEKAGAQSGHSAEKLTQREFQIYELLARGSSVSSIAQTLYLSVKTVHTHRANLMRKLRIKNNAELVMRAVQEGIVEP
ncbi:response regulator [Balneatrix alpica]|uniref:Response regulator n=1 Tax=Balneatrix alpica TaxID=75684 RepID=A0ABV5Z793_9GAMM|nr:response regulator transcription factor [Balneatrix alpica]